MNPLVIGHVVQTIQENRLADAAQSEQQHPLGWTAVQEPIQVGRSVLDELVASGQLRRLQPSTRGIGIVAAFHKVIILKLVRLMEYPLTPLI